MTTTLDDRETERLASQAALDHRLSAAERNRLGQFATPPALALEMADLAKRLFPEHGGVRLLDPALGTGVFFHAARKTFGPDRLRSALGFEVDPLVAAEAGRLWGSFGLNVRAEDFCVAAAPTDESEKANLILCNPPYVRHHHVSAARKADLRRRARKAGFQVSGLTGLYGYFLLLAGHWLAERGGGVWIVPAEFLDVNYGRALKDYLASRVTLHCVHRFDPEDVQFADALVSSVVVAFTNTPPAPGHVVQLTSGGGLAAPLVAHEVPLADLPAHSKWGPRFARPAALMTANGALTVGDLCTVRRGLATGANEFFILDRRQARALGLPDAFLRPILPGPRDVPGPSIERTEDGFPAGLPELVLLDCDLPMGRVQELHPALAAYLARGEEQGVSGRYLTAHRTLWYRQEQRPPAPILCTYMGRQNGGRAIRFLRNRSDATAPNVYLLLYPKPPLAAEARGNPGVIDELFRALTEVADDLAHAGRVYGGGLNKIEPKELEAIGLPPWAQERFGHLRAGRTQQPGLFAAGPDCIGTARE